MNVKDEIEKKMEKRTLYKLVVYDKNDNLTACTI